MAPGISRSVAMICFVLAGCGGGQTGPNPAPPPPPPPPVGPPATAAAHAAADQQGEPGTAVATRPALIVRDANGRAVAGVSVTFAVDSGGGTVNGPTATTGADGIATVGGWQLGPSEGRQILIGTAAALPAVRFVATAAMTTRTINDTSFVGGTIEVKQSGPLNGAKLEVPTGAFAGSTSWKLEQRSAADWPRRPGVNPVGAVLRITSSGSGLAAKPLRLTLPAPDASGHKPIVLMRDPASGGIIALPSYSDAPGTVTAMFLHLDGSYLATGPAAGGPAFGSRLRSAVATGYRADITVSSVAIADLDKDIDTGFKPGTDDFGFRAVETAAHIVGAPIQFGSTIGEMAYYAHLRSSSGKLWKKHEEAKGVEYSNRLGLRAVSWVAHVSKHEPLQTIIEALRTSVRQALIDQVFYDVLKANLLVTQLPQLVAAQYPDGSRQLFTAFRVASGEVFVASPFAPGDGARSVRFSNGSFATLADPVSHQPSSWVGALNIAQWLDMEAIATDVAAILAGRSPTDYDLDKGFFPTATLKIKNGFIEDTIVYVADTSRMWLECPGCSDGLTSQMTTAKTEPFQLFVEQTNRDWAVWGAGGADGRKWNLVNPSDERLGVLMQASNSPNGGGQWLDWQWIRVKKWVLDLTSGPVPAPMAVPSMATAPIALSGLQNEPTQFTVSLRGPAAPTHRFDWKFTRGSIIKTATSDPTLPVNLIFTDPGVYDLEVKMVRTSDDAVLSIVRTTAEIKEVKQIWRFVSLTKVTEVGNVDPNNPDAFFSNSSAAGDYSFHRFHMKPIEANPGVAVIYVYHGKDGSSVGIKKIPAGIVPSSPTIQLARTCPTPGCTSYALIITGDNKSGGIDGKYWPNNTMTALKNKDGVTLTGLFRIGEGGPAPSPLHYIDYSFTAVRDP